MADWMRKHWKLSLILFGVFAMVFIVVGVVKRRSAEGNLDYSTPPTGIVATENSGGHNNNSEDSLLMKNQKELVARYGNLPDGYLWNLDGTLLSQGDPSLSAEEVVYAYLNGLKSLDFSMVQKYSRNSRVVTTYSGYFDSKNPNTDYADSFYRNIYKQALLSFKVVGIESNSIFAENKQVFTVQVEMLDLTDKTFWEEDKYYIYSCLQIYNNEDSTKADMFLYEYILDYYKSGDASTRVVTFDLTLEKYVDLHTGWLVSIDTDVDNACKYSDGTPVVRHIRERFTEEGRDLLNPNINSTPTETSWYFEESEPTSTSDDLFPEEVGPEEG